MQTQLMDLKKITVDHSINGRHEINEAIVEDYANLMADGVKFPPGVVYFDGTTRWLAEGFHRYAANKLANNAAMLVEIRLGTRDDAIGCVLGSNQAHGLYRSSADKRRTVEVGLASERYSKISDRELAALAGVSHTLVAEVRNPAKAEERKAKKAGEKATPRDPKPTSKPGVTLSNPPPLAESATKSQVVHSGEAEPVDDSRGPGAEAAILSDALDQANDRIAMLAQGDAVSEEEKAAWKSTVTDLRHELAALQAERDSISHQFNAQVRECSELKAEVKRLRKKLDQAGKR